ncbi:hypothetical protein ACH5RR_013917 [Cinchona calisaya]|uniref:Auxin-responsive protein n=1 Tax=Cinchona calisaya TaxID=153742 RepID=A0ABD3A1D5_9GENT
MLFCCCNFTCCLRFLISGSNSIFSLMSLPLLGSEGEGQGNVSVMASSESVDCICNKGFGLEERNYLALSDSSSEDSCSISTVSNEDKSSLNLKDTDLRLGLPGSQFPERDSELNLPSSEKFDKKPLFPLLPSKDGICSSSQKTVVSGNKRGFLDIVDELSVMKASTFNERNWMFSAAGSDSETHKCTGQGKFAGKAGMSVLSNRSSGTQPSEMPSKPSAEGPHATNGSNHTKMNGSNNSSAPAAKAQVVGWPPIRSFRKNTLATTSKNDNEVDEKPSSGALFVKVSMAGAPYLRKVDLKTCSTYQELSSALEKMFSCFTIGQYGAEEASGKEMLSESKLRDLLHGSEYVLTYEDKDGDWMLVGDVPWEMFIETCKRLKIMKGSDAIGLAPWAMEKSKNRNWAWL